MSAGEYYRSTRGALEEHTAAVRARQGLELATTENVAKMWIDKYMQQRFQGERAKLSGKKKKIEIKHFITHF